MSRLRALDIPAAERAELEPLLDRPPVLASSATQLHDGRRIPLVFVRVRDRRGAARAGIQVRLLDRRGGRIFDSSRTDGDGLVVLRFPVPPNEEPTRRGIVEVTGSTAVENVAIPADGVTAILDVVVPALPPIPTLPNPRGGRPLPIPQQGDDIIPRLPPTFGSQVCDALGVVLPTRPHPILSLVPNVNPADFRTKTTPIIRRLSERRIGFVGPTGPTTNMGAGRGAVRRYVVRLRQEWKLLGYTLGELDQVQALDPGAVVEQVTRTADALTSRILDETQRLVGVATAWLEQALAQINSIDSAVKQTTDYTTKTISSGVPSIPAIPSTTVSVATPGFDVGGAVVGGLAGFFLGGPIGAVGGAAAGGYLAGAGKTTSVTVPGIPGVAGVPATSQVVPTLVDTVSTVDTTLEVSERLKTVQEQVNTATRQVHDALQTVQRMVGRSVEQVSPLLNRVTNLMRWRVYENYLVCTHVEDVLEVTYLRLPGCAGDEDMFSNEDVVEYRPFFEPRLLDPNVRPYYDQLARAVFGRDALLTSAYVEVTYRNPSTVTGTITVGQPPWSVEVRTETRTLPPTVLHVSIGSTSFSIPLPGGQGTTMGWFGLAPLRLARPFELRMTHDASQVVGTVAAPGFEEAAAQLEFVVDRVRIWFERPPTLDPDHDDTLDGGLRVTVTEPQRTIARSLTTPATEGEPINSPLTRHINRNCSYYVGLLLHAAMALPSLRDDAPQLANNPLFNSESPIWHMPIVGVEGDRLVFLRDADPADPNVVKWKGDPGTATIFQLAAPGAYAEALQGLLELADVLKYLHPALKQGLPPVLAPLPVTNLTGLGGTTPP